MPGWGCHRFLKVLHCASALCEITIGPKHSESGINDKKSKLTFYVLLNLLKIQRCIFLFETSYIHRL